MSVGVDMTGGDQIAAAIRTKLLKTSAAIGTVVIGVVAGERKPEKRGGTGRNRPELPRRPSRTRIVSNTMIAKVQAKLNRDPWYEDKDTASAIRFLVRGLLGADADQGRIFEQIGALLVEGVKRNIENQRGPGGATFRELTARYAAFKRRKFGFVHPVLVASRDLIDGLKAVITKQ